MPGRTDRYPSESLQHVVELCESLAPAAPIQWDGNDERPAFWRSVVDRLEGLAFNDLKTFIVTNRDYCIGYLSATPSARDRRKFDSDWQRTLVTVGAMWYGSMSVRYLSELVAERLFPGGMGYRAATAWAADRVAAIGEREARTSIRFLPQLTEDDFTYSLTALQRKRWCWDASLESLQMFEAASFLRQRG